MDQRKKPHLESNWSIWTVIETLKQLTYDQMKLASKRLKAIHQILLMGFHCLTFLRLLHMHTSMRAWDVPMASMEYREIFNENSEDWYCMILLTNTSYMVQHQSEATKTTWRSNEVLLERWFSETLLSHKDLPTPAGTVAMGQKYRVPQKPDWKVEK